MQKDEILEEIWEFRKKHALKFNYDVRKIMEDHKKIAPKKKVKSDTKSPKEA